MKGKVKIQREWFVKNTVEGFGKDILVTNKFGDIMEQINGELVSFGKKWATIRFNRKKASNYYHKLTGKPTLIGCDSQETWDSIITSGILIGNGYNLK